MLGVVFYISQLEPSVAKMVLSIGIFVWISSKPNGHLIFTSSISVVYGGKPKCTGGMF